MRTIPPNASGDRAASLTGVARRRLLSVIPVVAAVLAGCAAPGPTPSPRPAVSPVHTLTPRATPVPPVTGPATRLAVLAGNPRDADLVVVDDSGEVTPVALPVAATAWISADPAGRLLATTADGRLLLAGPLAGGGEPGWREVVPAYTGGAPAAPLSFGTLSPDGRTLAALAADFAAGTTFDLVLVDVGTSAATVLSIDAWPDGAAPAWLPDGRLLLVARDPARDLTGLVLVDPGHQEQALRFEREAYGIALSADGRVAAIDRTDGRLAAGATRLFIGGDPGAEGPEASQLDDPPGLLVTAPPGTAPGPFTLDPSGSRLAVTWLDDAGGPATVGRYRVGPDGSMAEAPLTVPNGAATAVSAWLP